MNRFGGEWDEFIKGLENASASGNKQRRSSGVDEQSISAQISQREAASKRASALRNKAEDLSFSTDDNYRLNNGGKSVQYVLAPDISSGSDVTNSTVGATRVASVQSAQPHQQGVKAPQNQMGALSGASLSHNAAQGTQAQDQKGISQRQIAAMLRPKNKPSQSQVYSLGSAINQSMVSRGATPNVGDGLVVAPQSQMSPHSNNDPSFEVQKRRKSKNPFASREVAFSSNRNSSKESLADLTLQKQKSSWFEIPKKVGSLFGSSRKTENTSDVNKKQFASKVFSRLDSKASQNDYQTEIGQEDLHKSSHKDVIKGLDADSKRRKRIPFLWKKDSKDAAELMKSEPSFSRQSKDPIEDSRLKSNFEGFSKKEDFSFQGKTTEDGLYLPSMAEVESELQIITYRKRYLQLLRNTLSVLIVAAAIAALVATIWMPVLQIYGKSMYPTLEEGEIVISFKAPDLQTGDPVAFYYNNKLLIKRVIASPGQTVDIDSKGDVYVDGKLIDEPYLNEKSFEPCDIELPYQVPDQRWFVLGDNRSVSVDSRDSSIGCIPKEYIVGRVEFCVWPLNKFGWV